MFVSIEELRYVGAAISAIIKFIKGKANASHSS